MVQHCRRKRRSLRSRVRSHRVSGLTILTPAPPSRGGGTLISHIAIWATSVSNTAHLFDGDKPDEVSLLNEVSLVGLEGILPMDPESERFKPCLGSPCLQQIFNGKLTLAKTEEMMNILSEIVMVAPPGDKSKAPAPKKKGKNDSAQDRVASRLRDLAGNSDSEGDAVTWGQR